MLRKRWVIYNWDKMSLIVAFTGTLFCVVYIVFVHVVSGKVV